MLYPILVTIFFFFSFSVFYRRIESGKNISQSSRRPQTLNSEPIKNSNPPGAHIVHDINLFPQIPTYNKTCNHNDDPQLPASSAYIHRIRFKLLFRYTV